MLTSLIFWYFLVSRTSNIFRLWLLFQSLPDDSPMRYHVYYHLVQIARNVDQVKAVYGGIDQLKQQFASLPPSNEQMQKLLRLLHEVLLSCKQG